MIKRLGTSKEMILQSVEENNIPLLLAIDSRGLYLTEEKYLNKDIADPNRCAGNRISIEERLKGLGINYKETFETNKSLIQVMATEAKKKVNPLKASKRSMKK